MTASLIVFVDRKAKMFQIPFVLIIEMEHLAFPHSQLTIPTSKRFTSFRSTFNGQPNTARFFKKLFFYSLN